ILVTEKKLDLLKSNKERFQKILKVTKLRAKQGAAKKVDVQQVQVNLNNVLSQISTVQNSIEIARNTLNNNMGLPPSSSITLIDAQHWLEQSPHLKIYPDFDYSNTLSSQLQQTKMELLYYNK